MLLSSYLFINDISRMIDEKTRECGDENIDLGVLVERV
jgi:hypothetical protein